MKRYITAFNTEELVKHKKEVLIIGSGIASLYTALMFQPTIHVTILSKASYKETNSYLAQGGIAAPMGKRDDPRKHFDDTMICGKNVNHTDAVWALVNEANQNMNILMDLGVKFDRDSDGEISFGKEGAHSMARILHAGGDQTGQKVMEALYHQVINHKNIELIENAFVIDLLSNREGCIGALAYIHGEKEVFYSAYTIVATGGIGQIYSRTTNANGIQGDGIAMALRAGAEVKDMHGVQFHPTGFYDEKEPQKKHAFLISEAVRGEGAILLNNKKEHFMKGIHPLEDLAPRDIVASAIHEQIRKQELPYVYLDITHKSREDLMSRFPKIFAYCQKKGIDISQDLIPVAPVAHYFMGGIAVDLNGATTVRRLYACGECACTGAHGENRLASNSLLEAIVFGKRIAEHIQQRLTKEDQLDLKERIFSPISVVIKIPETVEEQLEKRMMNDCGIVRTKKELQKLLKDLQEMKSRYTNGIVSTEKEIGFINKLTVAYMMVDHGLRKKKINSQEERIW